MSTEFKYMIIEVDTQDGTVELRLSPKQALELYSELGKIMDMKNNNDRLDPIVVSYPRPWLESDTGTAWRSDDLTGTYTVNDRIVIADINVHEERYDAQKSNVVR